MRPLPFAAAPELSDEAAAAVAEAAAQPQKPPGPTQYAVDPVRILQRKLQRALEAQTVAEQQADTAGAGCDQLMDELAARDARIADLEQELETLRAAAAEA